MKNLKSKKGFTLVELIVVIVILGVLMAIAIPNVVAYIDKANVKADGLAARNVYLAAASTAAEEYGDKSNWANGVFTMPEGAGADIAALADVTSTTIAFVNRTTGAGAADAGKYTVVYNGNEIVAIIMGKSLSASGQYCSYEPNGTIKFDKTANPLGTGE